MNELERPLVDSLVLSILLRPSPSLCGEGLSVFLRSLAVRLREVGTAGKISFAIDLSPTLAHVAT